MVAVQDFAGKSLSWHKPIMLNVFLAKKAHPVLVAFRADRKNILPYAEGLVVG